MDISRRELIQTAALMGATIAWAAKASAQSRAPWREERSRFPQGVASGDPRPDSVILWTRCPSAGQPQRLLVEVAEDPSFRKVVATTTARASADADWTVRVVAAGLQPNRVYFYRFTQADGAGSRIGRTITAPSDDDDRPVQFAFVSCQNVNYGCQHAYRRMIFEDERADPANQIGFVLHLGDFIYELVWYPEDRPRGMYGRPITEFVRLPDAQRVDDFHIPTDVEGYRAIYRAYLLDPDLQDARARWPFVAMWDNHEFSWMGWQSFQEFDGRIIPAQTRKVAANQAWFEYQPARVQKPGADPSAFLPPRVANAPIERFDDNGLGQEPNNLAAINSLIGYRALRWGRHVDLIITDEHSYRSREPSGRPEAKVFQSPDFPDLIPQEVLEILDAGRRWNQGSPPQTIRYGASEFPNFRRDEPAQTIFGAQQKAWFLERLGSSRATWKIWGSTLGTLDWRADPQNLPQGITRPWPGEGYAGFGGGDHSAAYIERAEIYDFVKRNAITGFATVAGDRHSFWAGLAAKALPPKDFDPVGIAFVTGSISAPGLVEALEQSFPREHPLRSLFLIDRPGRAKPEASVNMLLRHGVKSCLEYARSGDLPKAKSVSNPDNAPHLQFVDLGGHGYAVIKADAGSIDAEFVCLPRPIHPNESPDGGPLRYRVSHRAELWPAGERPLLQQRVLEGDVELSA